MYLDYDVIWYNFYGVWFNFLFIDLRIYKVNLLGIFFFKIN